MRASRICVLLCTGIVAALSAGCVSNAPIHYYTLVAPQAKTVATPASFDIDVRPVLMPPALRQQAMVLRTGSAAVLVQDNHQWAAPLPAEVRTAVSSDLVTALGTRDLAGLPSAGRPVYRVLLAISDFDAVYGGKVSISATWALQKGNGTTLLVCSGSTSQPTAGAGYRQLAVAAQKALATLAQRIGTALKALPEARCPA